MLSAIKVFLSGLKFTDYLKIAFVLIAAAICLYFFFSINSKLKENEQLKRELSVTQERIEQLVQTNENNAKVIENLTLRMDATLKVVEENTDAKETIVEDVNKLLKQTNKKIEEIRKSEQPAEVIKTEVRRAHITQLWQTFCVAEELDPRCSAYR